MTKAEASRFWKSLNPGHALYARRNYFLRLRSEAMKRRRQQLPELLARGLTQSQIAQELGIVRRTVVFYMRQLRSSDPEFRQKYPKRYDLAPDYKRKQAKLLKSLR